MKILDVGCGLVPKLTSDYLEIDIVSCDRQETYGVDVQNMEKLTYPDKSFDVVICINALDHTRNAQGALEEILRVVRSGGWVYINCALDQMTRHHKKHYWDVKADGMFVSPAYQFDLKDYGFEIEFDDGRMIASRNG